MFLFKPLHDFDDMLDAFALAKDNFGKAFAQRPMMIKASKTDIFVWQVTQTFDSAFDRASTGAHFS